MAEYSFVKGGKLKLKGSKSTKKHKKHKKRERDEEDQVDDEALRHGGWWNVKSVEEMQGAVAIELGLTAYIQALDNGLFKLGSSHDIGEGPDPEEILTCVRLGETNCKLALKSGFDKYLSVNQNGSVIGRSDAIGSREQWDVVISEEKIALQGCNGCFMSVSGKGDVICTSETVPDDQIMQMRSSAKKEKKQKTEDAIEKAAKVKDTELNYVKKFQSFEDRRIKLNPEDRSALRRAKDDGNLHEVMLDRREKMKSDKFCK